MASELIVHTQNLIKEFPDGDGTFRALDDINLEISSGEFMGFIGPSGSGKTTLLNIIGSLDKPTSGEVQVLGKDMKKLSNKEAAEMRNYHIGFIFQIYNLLPVYTVYENVEFALLLQNNTATERKKAVMEALEWVGLENYANKKVPKLSGGEGQRVAIARAMVKRPDILIADEPTANLDAENAFMILDLMKKLNEELKTTFIFSTHDEKVMKYLDRIVSLKDGKIVSSDAQINTKIMPS